jgi:hypothetical protein
VTDQIPAFTRLEALAAAENAIRGRYTRYAVPDVDRRIGLVMGDVQVALDAAAPVIAAQAAAAVYDWLVTVVAYPFDFTFDSDPPAWLDLRQLAEAWHRHEPGESAEQWLDAITLETGWDAP